MKIWQAYNQPVSQVSLVASKIEAIEEEWQTEQAEAEKQELYLVHGARTKPITTSSPVPKHVVTKPEAPTSRQEKPTVALTVTEVPRPRSTDDLDNVIGKLLSEKKPIPATHEGSLVAMERNLAELFDQEEKRHQKECEESWARIERGEAESEPEMTEEECELERLAAMYGNDADEEQENPRVHGRVDDRDQSRRRGRGR